MFPKSFVSLFSSNLILKDSPVTYSRHNLGLSWFRFFRVVPRLLDPGSLSLYTYFPNNTGLRRPQYFVQTCLINGCSIKRKEYFLLPSKTFLHVPIQIPCLSSVTLVTRPLKVVSFVIFPTLTKYTCPLDVRTTLYSDLDNLYPFTQTYYFYKLLMLLFLVIVNYTREDE